MSKQQDQRKTKVVASGLGMFKFVWKPSQPTGDHPLPETLFFTHSLEVIGHQPVWPRPLRVCYNDPLRIPSPIHMKNIPMADKVPMISGKFPASTVVFLRGSLITSGEWMDSSWVSAVNCEVVHPWIFLWDWTRHSPGPMGMIPFVGTVANMTYKTAGAAEKSLDPLGGFPGMMIVDAGCRVENGTTRLGQEPAGMGGFLTQPVVF